MMKPFLVEKHDMMRLWTIMMVIFGSKQLMVKGQQTTIFAKFPAEGFDYTSGNLRGNIFDMSRLNGTVFFTNSIEVPLPFNIGNVQPSTKLVLDTNSRTFSKVSELSESNAVHSSSSWSLGTDYQSILQNLAGQKGKSLGRNSPTNILGFEVGGSQRSEHYWAQSRLESIQGSVIETQASYDYVEVFMRPVTEAELLPNFLRSFALLPTDPWETLSEPEKRRFQTFFKDYGTHYVQAAKFGGSYTSTAFAQDCDLVIEKQSSNSLEACLGARITAGFGGPLGLANLEISNALACNGYTSNGNIRSEWTSSIVQSTETWEGGNLEVAPDIRSGDFGMWIQDVQQNPRSVPTQISSIPDLFRDIAGAFSLSGDFCTPCLWLKEEAGIAQESVDAIIDNLEEAFVAHLYSALETKVEAEDVCNKECGRCKLPPPPESGCTCPEADIEYCQIEGPELMEVYISTIEFAVDYMFKGKTMRMHLSNLGPPHDSGNIAGGRRRITLHVDATFLRQRGDYIRIEVVRGESGFKGLNACVGSVNFPVEKVGSGDILSMEGSCNHGKSRMGKNPRTAINGNVTFPYCCNCTSYMTSNVEPEVDPLVEMWAIILVSALGGLCCCSCLLLWARGRV